MPVTHELFLDTEFSRAQTPKAHGVQIKGQWKDLGGGGEGGTGNIVRNTKIDELW